MIDAGAARPDQATFGSSTVAIARTSRGMVWALILGAAGFIIAEAVELHANATGAKAVQIDFAAFWAAAKLALSGPAISAFDAQTLFAAQSLGSEVPFNFNVLWHYPPTFHLLILPLGLLGFTAAHAVFVACSVGAFSRALKGWEAPVSGGRNLVLAAPAVWITLRTGNTSLLWTAALLCGLACLVRGRVRTAGLMIALLTLKPQLGLLIPFALIGGGHWRTVSWAVLATLAMVAFTLPIYGTEYWAAFFDALGETAQMRSALPEKTQNMVSWYALAHQYGANQDTALLMQLVGFIAAAALIYHVWRQKRFGFDLKTASLLIAAPISSPYAFINELVIVVAGALFLARAGIGRSASGRAVLMILWLAPVPILLIPGLEIAYYAAPVLTLCLFSGLVIATRLDRGRPLPPGAAI